tara:strand:- start:864 stop:983 length:120 start_codon:yes stop_codon:yes gene_type:complete
MVKKNENEFNVMIFELLNSGRKLKEIGDEYGLNEDIVRR